MRVDQASKVSASACSMRSRTELRLKQVQQHRRLAALDAALETLRVVWRLERFAPAVSACSGP
jgi:hypothetical protein